MNRRDALKSISVILGGAIIGSRSILNGQSNPDAAIFARRITDSDIALLDEVGETILPTTSDSLGAKAAKIGEFMRENVSNYYSDEERGVFLAGIGKLNAFSREQTSRGFMELSPEERYELLLKMEESDLRYYRMMKQLTLYGYFTSEIGSKQALAHLPVPGRWDACIDVGPRTKAWS